MTRVRVAKCSQAQKVSGCSECFQRECLRDFQHNERMDRFICDHNHHWQRKKSHFNAHFQSPQQKQQLLNLVDVLPLLSRASESRLQLTKLPPLCDDTYTLDNLQKRAHSLLVLVFVYNILRNPAKKENNVHVLRWFQIQMTLEQRRKRVRTHASHQFPCIFYYNKS